MALDSVRQAIVVTASVAVLPMSTHTLGTEDIHKDRSLVYDRKQMLWSIYTQYEIEQRNQFLLHSYYYWNVCQHAIENHNTVHRTQIEWGKTQRQQRQAAGKKRRIKRSKRISDDLSLRTHRKCIFRFCHQSLCAFFICHHIPFAPPLSFLPVVTENNNHFRVFFFFLSPKHLS